MERSALGENLGHRGIPDRGAGTHHRHRVREHLSADRTPDSLQERVQVHGGVLHAGIHRGTHGDIEPLTVLTAGDCGNQIDFGRLHEKCG